MQIEVRIAATSAITLIYAWLPVQANMIVDMFENVAIMIIPIIHI